MSPGPARTARPPRAAAFLTRFGAVALVGALALVLLLAPADTVSPATTPSGFPSTIVPARPDGTSAVGDHVDGHERGISWAARSPRRAAPVSTVALLAGVAIVVLASVRRSRAELRPEAAERSGFTTSSVCRGPPAASLARP